MRKRISDSNIYPIFSLEEEYRKLQNLFYDRNAFGKIIVVTQKTRPNISYNDCLEAMFLDWSLRGTFINAEEMLFGLGISEKHFEEDISENRLLDYIQFILNAVLFVDEMVRTHTYSIYQAGHSICDAIVDNCRYILDRLGAKLERDGKEIYVVYKDDVATVIAKYHEDLDVSITEYLKIDNRGDLQRKGEILCTLAKKLEPFEKKLCATEFKALCTDTTTLLNKIGARHALKPEQKLESKFLEMDNQELEEWYDSTFNMLLGCFAVLPYLEMKPKIKDIKSGC